MRIIAGLTILLFYFAFFGTVGFFSLGLEGETYGLIIALSIVLVTALLGDRLFLVLIKAKEVDYRSHETYFRLQNLMCQKSLPNVRIYKSFLIPENTYCLHPLFNEPCIIMSDKFFRASTDPDLLEICLEEAINYLQKGKGRWSNFISFLVTILLSPKYFFEKFQVPFLGLIYSYIFFPLVFLKDFVVESSLGRGPGPANQNSLKMTYHLDRFTDNQVGLIADLSKDLSLFKKRESSLWSSLLGGYSDAYRDYVKWHERKN